MTSITPPRNSSRAQCSHRIYKCVVCLVTPGFRTTSIPLLESVMTGIFPLIGTAMSHVAGRWRRLARQVLGRRVVLGEWVPWNERSHVSTVTRNVCVNLNSFTRSESTVSVMDTTRVRHGVCSDSSTHHNTGTQIQHLPHIKHTSLTPRSPRRPPNQPHYVNYEIITDRFK